MIFARGIFIDAPDMMMTPIADLEEPDYGGEELFRFPSGGTLEDLECAYIKHILHKSNASYSDVANLLGISKKTLWDKRKRYNLDDAVAA